MFGLEIQIWNAPRPTNLQQLQNLKHLHGFP